ncbi:hypothetical protein ACFQY5_01640 [Paeniroseomonas aquatica]|uniref:HAMP domain-containing protein n=1 Tax=Paeniroseomonas aquatica TaxID=373043 RepID=A0ABT8A2L9_9PROT|nr:hypothetical protein [Paeniroseomonas aquatica]MDN3564002.1 hypothetical protein [Paeniroseomonas aquatica]
MSDGARDPMAMAAARLEAAVERLAQAVARPRAVTGREDSETVPRAEVAAMAERLDATIARLRVALAEELRPAPSETD